MIAEIWIKIQGKKRHSYTNPILGTVHASKKKPETMEDEIAVKLVLDIPDEVFEEPIYEAKLVLPKTTRQLPDQNTIAKEVGAELSKKMGFKVRLEMPAEKDAES